MISKVGVNADNCDLISQKDLLKIKALEEIQEQFGDELFSGNVWKNVNRLLDFGSSKNLDLSGLSESEKDQLLKILSTLFKKGIIGWEYYEVDGQIEKHFVDVSIGDQRLAGGMPVKWSKPDGYY